jgi:hypothetical protein
MAISLHFSKRDICGYEVTSKYIKEFSQSGFCLRTSGTYVDPWFSSVS